MFKVEAVVEINAEKREDLIKNGVPFVYAEYKKFLSDSHKLDMVIISTSDALHKEQAVACQKKRLQFIAGKTYCNNA